MRTHESALRVLVVGESWIKHTVHMKGFDAFNSTEYEEGAGFFLNCLEASGFAVTYLRAHEISGQFPSTKEALESFDVVVISDVGANSFLLTDATFLRSERTANRLSVLADYVRGGGGLVMVGGYLSFTGIDGKARYKVSPLAAVLPVDLLDHDDRIESPEGVVPSVDAPDHEILDGVTGEWPILLGYNRVVAKSESTVVARVGSDPLLVVGRFGAGHSVAFTSDLAPHWAPPEFLNWPHYRQLWASVLTWAAQGSSAPSRPALSATTSA